VEGLAVLLGALAEMSKGSLAVFQGVGLVLVASPPATVKPDRFDESEAGVLKVVPEAPWLFLSSFCNLCPQSV